MRKLKTKNSPKILIVGGHLTPALAVTEELLKREHYNIVWVGHKYSQTGDKNLSAEYGQITKKGIHFIALRSGKIWRKWTLSTLIKALLNLLLIPIGYFRAFSILAIHKPDIIISFGGYLSVPVLSNYLINKINRSKIYIHMQTSQPDLSTKLTMRFADKIFLSWDDSKKYFQNTRFLKAKILVTGNPLRQQLLSKPSSSKLFDNNLPTLLIFGGNQGANTFNRRLHSPILERYLESMNIIHQTGSSSITGDYQIAHTQRKKLSKRLQQRYLIYNFISTEELNEFYSHASLALARSGANTTYEILFKGLPAIFMPLPWSSNNEQLNNAEIAAETGLADIFEFYDNLTSEELFNRIQQGIERVQSAESFKKRVSWIAAKKNAKEKIKFDAAKNIVDRIF